MDRNQNKIGSYMYLEIPGSNTFRYVYKHLHKYRVINHRSSIIMIRVIDHNIMKIERLMRVECQVCGIGLTVVSNLISGVMN